MITKAMRENPFLQIMLAAMDGRELTLTPRQCRRLIKNGYVYQEAVEAVPFPAPDLQDFLGNPDTYHLGIFRKLAALQKREQNADAS